jgi:hypothetical protein
MGERHSACGSAGSGVGVKGGTGQPMGGDGGQVGTRGWGVAGFMLSTLARCVGGNSTGWAGSAGRPQA